MRVLVDGQQKEQSREKYYILQIQGELKQAINISNKTLEINTSNQHKQRNYPVIHACTHPRMLSNNTIIHEFCQSTKRTSLNSRF